MIGALQHERDRQGETLPKVVGPTRSSQEVVANPIASSSTQSTRRTQSPAFRIRGDGAGTSSARRLGWRQPDSIGIANGKL